MTETSGPAEGISAADTLRLLRWVARPGAQIANGHDGSMSILRATPSGLMSLGEVAQGAWAGAVAVGFVAAEPGTSEWRLTRKGRSHLKRLLSRCGEPVATTTASCAAASGPGTCPCDGSATRGGSRPGSRRAGHARPSFKGGAAMIGEAEFQAGERLRADFWFAGLTPRVTTNWSAVGGSGGAGPGLGLELKDSIVAARERVHRALAAVGPELADVLIDVCCHLKGLEDAERRAGWPARSGKVVLQLALRRLARHYGLIRDGDANRPARVRHWGSSDFRPTLD